MAVGLSHGAKPRVLQSSLSTRPTSQRPSSTLLSDLQIQCPDGYEVYQKEEKDMKEKNAQKDHEETMAKNGEVPAKEVDKKQVHEASLAPKEKCICQDHFVNSKSRNAGGYPTGDAPTQRVDPDTLIFRDVSKQHLSPNRIGQILGNSGLVPETLLCTRVP